MPIFGRSKRSKSTSAASSQSSTLPARPHPSKHQELYSPTNQQSSNTPYGYNQLHAAQPFSPPHVSPYASQNLSVPPPHPLRSQKSALSNLKLSSAASFLAEYHMPDCPHLQQGAALYDTIAAKFNAVVTQIDNECFSGNENDLAVLQQPQPIWQQEQQVSGYGNQISQGKSKGMVNGGVSSALTSTNYFSKVNLYANSKLPPSLPPMKLLVLVTCACN